MSRKWSGRKYAVLASLHRHIRIGVLSTGCLMLVSIPTKAQADTTETILHYMLEEVEAVGTDELESESPELRQFIILPADQLQQEYSSSLSSVLDQYPGIDMRTRGVLGIQSDLNINGASFDQSIVLLNGMNLGNSQSGHFNMDLPLLASQLEKVEILKGSASRNHGLNAYAGAVNMITQPEEELSFQGGIKTGSFRTFASEVSLHLPLGRSRNLLAVSGKKSQGYRENTDFKQLGIYTHSVLPIKHLKAEMIHGFSSKSFGANGFYSPKYPWQYEETFS